MVLRLGRIGSCLALTCLLAAAPSVRADSSSTMPRRDIVALPADDDFGNKIVIESIEVRGNESTSSKLIERSTGLTPGLRVRAGSKRLRNARYKVQALGFFREVTLTMRRGSVRGNVVVVVTVVERRTVALNRLWFGTSASSRVWLGTDISERNFLGSGVSVGGAFVYANHGGIIGSRDQFAGELRIGAAEIRGTRWSLGTALTAVRGSEPYRVSGSPDDADDDAPAGFDTFGYRRLGVRTTASYDLSSWTRLAVGLRAERVNANLADQPIRTLPSGELVPIDLHLQNGSSDVVTGSLGYDRDTRVDPVLPHDGDRLQMVVEAGVRALVGDYHFATAAAKYERFWPLRDGRHAISLKLGGGIGFGDVPRFDRLHLGDVNRLVTPRAVGLSLSGAPAPNFPRTRSSDDLYGDYGGSASVEYIASLFRSDGTHLFGGDLFFSVGAWALVNRNSLIDPSRTPPMGLTLDAGLRLDTEFGIFELTLSNALGRFAL